jgi:Uma2 family endonuclease
MLYDFSKTPEADRVREAARIGYNAFLDALDEDTRAELVDGEVEFMSPLSLIHIRIGYFLHRIIDEYLERHPTGQVTGDGLQMKIGTKTSRVPDLFFLRNEHLDRLHDTYLDGAADIVVEVVSPDSVRKDREQKFREYAAGGIPEYWIIDSVRGVSEFYTLPNGASQYEAAALDANGLFHSRQLPGLRINPEWLKKDPLPSVKSVLAEAGIVDDNA